MILSVSAITSSTENCTQVIGLEAMRINAENATTLLKTLANTDRMLLLCRLAEGEACVSELEKGVGIAQPTLSQQLGVLRKEDLVVTRREGKHIYYRIKSGPALQLLKTIHDIFCVNNASVV